MAKCQICGKKARVGRVSKHRRGVASRRFAHRAPKKKKVFRPNIQKTTITIGGVKLRLRVCASCLKKMKAGKLTLNQVKAATDKQKKTEKK
ncbi:50S ribosomal protein L28 [bacterium]|nr:50S ribosomal protein L28 [bacterium]